MGNKRIRSKPDIKVWYPCPECFRTFPMMGEDNIIRHVMLDHPFSDLAVQVKIELAKTKGDDSDG